MYQGVTNPGVPNIEKLFNRWYSKNSKLPTKEYEYEYIKISLIKGDISPETKIKLAVKTKNIDLISSVMNTITDNILKNIQNNNYNLSVIIYQLKTIFKKVDSLRNQYPEYNLIDGCRNMGKNLIESFESCLQSPKKTFEIRNFEQFIGCPEERKISCTCSICLKLFDILNQNVQSKKFRVDTEEEIEHVKEIINNGIIGYGISLEKLLNEIVSLEIKPWGKSKYQINVIKKEQIEYKYQPLQAIIDILSDLMLKYIPSTQKRARVPTIPPPDEPQTKIQKIN